MSKKTNKKHKAGIPVIIGMKHCGKSTIGRLLAQKTGAVFYDLDNLIEEVTHKTPRQWFDEGGLEGFITQELKAAQHFAQTSGVPAEKAVLATGGGFCDNEQAIALLRPLSTFVFLQTPEKVLWQRIEGSRKRDGRYPSYISRENPQTEQEASAVFARFFKARNEKYKKMADIIIETEGLTLNEVAQLCLDVL